MTSIYLVRHATPDWARVDLPYHLPPGPPLTSQGESEAEALGAFLREAGVRRYFTSPLERCRRTAEIAALAAEAAVQAEPGLAEWQPGESEAQVRERFWPVWERAHADNGRPDGPAALVTHGGPIAMMLADLGLDANALAHYRRTFDRSNPLPPAGVWRASRPAPDGPWELELAYMPEAYRKDWIV